MLTAAPITVRQYREANAKIISMFGFLEEIVNVLDTNHLKGQTLRNTRELFPMADNFVRNVSEATHTIHESYVDYVQRGGHASDDHAKAIEREGTRIFREIQNVILQARKLNTHPATNRFKSVDEPTAGNFQQSQTHHHSERRTRKGPIETALFQEARRLEPEYGSHFLLSVEDTYLAAIDMFHSIRVAGIHIDMDQLLATATSPQMQVKTGDMDAGDANLLALIRRRREEATKAWATGKTR